MLKFKGCHFDGDKPCLRVEFNEIYLSLPASRACLLINQEMESDAFKTQNSSVDSMGVCVVLPLHTELTLAWVSGGKSCQVREQSGEADELSCFMEF